MKFTVNRIKFIDALALALRARATSSTLPVLSLGRIYAADESVRVAATNLDIYLDVPVEAGATVDEAGAAVVPIARIHAALRVMDTEFVMVESRRDGVLLVNASTTLYFAGLPNEDWPGRPDKADSQRIGQVWCGKLLQMIEAVAFSLSADDSRYVLNGIYFEAGAAGLRLVSTDGRRLSVFETASICSVRTDFILPKRAAQAVARLAARAAEFDETTEVEILQGASVVIFRAAGVMLVSKVIDGQFPEYRKIFPEASPLAEFPIDPAMMCRSLDRVSVVCKDSGEPVMIAQGEGGSLQLNTEHQEIGKGVEQMLIGPGESFAPIKLNHTFLRQALASAPFNQVALRIYAPNSPVVLSAEGWTHLLMPMRGE